MKRESLDKYDVLPPAMENYLRHYGRHFSEAMYKFAVSRMYRETENGKHEHIDAITREQFESLMSSYGIMLENDVLYDGMYVYCMAMSDFYGKSLADELHVCQFVKDTVDDVDQADGFIFNRFYSDMVRKGEPIPWSDCL